MVIEASVALTLPLAVTWSAPVVSGIPTLIVPLVAELVISPLRLRVLAVPLVIINGVVKVKVAVALSASVVFKAVSELGSLVTDKLVEPSKIFQLEVSAGLAEALPFTATLTVVTLTSSPLLAASITTLAKVHCWVPATTVWATGSEETETSSLAVLIVIVADC